CCTCAPSALPSFPTRRSSDLFRFGDINLRLRGPLDLVERQGRVGADAPANVYPDLREIRRYEVTLRRGLAYDAGQRRARVPGARSEEHTSELQSPCNLVCRLL